MLNLLCLASVSVGVGAMDVWVPDPMDKVLADALAPAEARRDIAIDAARGEYEGAQIALRSDSPVIGLRVTASDLTEPGGARIPAGRVECLSVATVPLKWATPGSTAHRVAPAGADVPDPLPPIPEAGLELPASHTTCLYLRLRVPSDAEPGEYAGEVRLAWAGGEASVAIALRVWPVTIPEERHLQFTNWVNHYAFASQYEVEPESDEYYRIVEAYARDAHEHRQTMLWVPSNWIELHRAADGALRCDFARFDRWIEMCESCGVCDRIEITQLGGCDREAGAIVLSAWSVRDDATGETASAPAREALTVLLPALQEHLRERGWLERTLLHIADEPFVQSVPAFRETAAWVRSLAPEIRLIDAIEAPDFGDSLDVWVPKLSHFNHWMDTYREAQRNGAEMWFYTCCHPHPPYPSRFLDESLSAVRVLHWLNWRYDLPGYLHWGLNFWGGLDPWTNCATEGLPPGDCWIVYPGEEGPVSSLRWETVRDGIEDYELLWTLTDRTRALLAELGAPDGLFDPGQRADELAARIVRTPVDWERDPAALRAVRREALEAIVALETDSPRLYVETDPPTHRALTQGPIAVAVRGVAEPGAAVTVNGEAAFMQPDGTFLAHAFIGGSGTATVTATLGERETTVTRMWRLTEAE